MNSDVSQVTFDRILLEVAVTTMELQRLVADLNAHKRGYKRCRTCPTIGGS